MNLLGILDSTESYICDCCGCSNRIVALLVAGVGLIVSSIIILISIIWIAVGLSREEDEDEIEFENSKMVNIAIAALIISLISIILNVLLYCGVHFLKHNMMVPWLIVSLFTIVFSLPVGIFATVGSFNAELSRLRLTRENLSSVMAAERRHENFYPVLIWIICTPFECYIWNVVFCVYKELRISIRKRHGVRNIVLMQDRMYQMEHSKTGHSRRI